MASLSDDLAGVTERQPEVPREWQPHSTWDGEQGELVTGPIKSASPDLITNFDGLLIEFGYDPAHIEIVGTVNQWRKKQADGTWLISYFFKIQRRVTTDAETVDVEALSARLWKPAGKVKKSKRVPVAAVLNMADLQLHKGDPAATIDRVRAGIAKFQAYVERHRAAGVNINEIVLVNNGDPFEGIAGNYANQTNTIWHGGLRAQMNTVLDVWTYAAHEVFPLAPKTQFVSVLCNHTQFGRQGGAKDAITGDSDNGSAFLAETMRRILGDRYRTEWTIPHDDMNVYAELAGVKVGFNHGHKIPGQGAQSFEKWLGGQVRYDTRAYEARVWITAHKHHFASWDMGSAFVYQCPSCDDGSKWLTDTTGIHARSGMLAMLIGQHDPLSTSDATFI